MNRNDVITDTLLNAIANEKEKQWGNPDLKPANRISLSAAKRLVNLAGQTTGKHFSEHLEELGFTVVKGGTPKQPITYVTIT